MSLGFERYTESTDLNQCECKMLGYCIFITMFMLLAMSALESVMKSSIERDAIA